MGNAKKNKKIRFATTAKGTKIWYVRVAKSTTRRPLNVRKKKSARVSKTG